MGQQCLVAAGAVISARGMERRKLVVRPLKTNIASWDKVVLSRLPFEQRHALKKRHLLSAEPLGRNAPQFPLLLFGAFLAVRALGRGADYMLLRAMIADIADGDEEGAPRFSASYYGVSSVTVAMGLSGAGGLRLIDLVAQAIWLGKGDFILRLAFGAPAILAALVALFLLSGGRQVPLNTGNRLADA